MPLIFKPKEVIAFIDDRNTDSDQKTSAFQPLGLGYVHDEHHLLQAGLP